MEDQLSRLIDREAVIDTINRLFISTDQRDWSAVRACFATEVYFDMASAGGGEAAWLLSKQITDVWEQGSKGVKGYSSSGRQPPCGDTWRGGRRILLCDCIPLFTWGCKGGNTGFCGELRFSPEERRGEMADRSFPVQFEVC